MPVPHAVSSSVPATDPHTFAVQLAVVAVPWQVDGKSHDEAVV